MLQEKTFTERIPELEGKVEELPATETWARSFHVFDRRSLVAIDTARAAKRPLLVRGETGTGKSQLARAAAKVLGYHFVSKVIDAQTEIEDLWFRYDAVKRLGEAQLLSIVSTKDSEGSVSRDVNKELAAERFIVPGPMWWTFDRNGAAKHCQKVKLSEQEYALYLNKETLEEASESKRPSVLLLDEIDKADVNLANSLLEALGNSSFRVSILGEIVGARDASICPLVVITSNDEKQLPPAFLRRCVVLELSLPEDPDVFRDLLCKRGRQHHQGNNGKSSIADKVLEEAASQLWNDREKAKELGLPLPGQAEYLDILNVLVENAKGTENQSALLKEISEFVFQKHSSLRESSSEIQK